MPDKWEYPWFAAWDLAFHTLALSTVDIIFAMQQLDLLLDQVYLHPTGQIPAYEWNFSDVNPPVHAWAAIFVYRMEQALHGKTDLDFLKRVFGKLTSNFGWWINRKDRCGRSLFEGGFLGLDNIGVFDRSAPLPTGGYLEQADGTAWVALFCQNMLEIAFELAAHDPTYQDLAAKFAFEFLLIARAMNGIGPDGMWDEEDGFYYDVLRLPDGNATRLKVRSMVGLLPLCAVTAVDKQQRERTPRLTAQMIERVRRMPELFESIHPTGPGHLGVAARGILGLVNQDRLRRILRDDAGRRPVFGGAEKFQRDPHWRDHLLFYEYFHGDNGTDLGASHQTGWTGGVALVIEIFGKLDAQTFLQGGREAMGRRRRRCSSRSPKWEYGRRPSSPCPRGEVRRPGERTSGHSPSCIMMAVRPSCGSIGGNASASSCA
jgi:hypothetical protein